MKLYKFSPIKNYNELVEAIKYVSSKSSKLCEKIIGKKLSIKSLTIFSHYENEYENLKNILSEIGDLYNENNGPRVKLKEKIVIENNIIEFLRIRKPDPYRMQVGCNDFEIDNYKEFKEQYLEENNNLKLFIREKYEMIEFFHPDFDVLAYVVS
ncbi:MAG: hypothetical protein PHE25_02925 [Candidatus Gracilibacteria bacterium]|nr:hypothetical protein [Candidatus Gracilibacteria bacterium]